MPALVPACARTMAVFEVFAREKRELLVSDLARFLDVADSSASDLLHTLHHGGYLVRTVKTRRFYPSGRLYETACEIGNNDPLHLAGTELVESLRDRTGESAFCAKLNDGAAKVIATVEGKHPLRYVLHSGERIALHASALGKALLADLDPFEMRRQIRLKPMRKVARNTIESPHALEVDVVSQRERGWYSVEEEGADGVMALALPTRIGSQTVALSMAGPVERMKMHRDAYLAALHQVVTSVGPAK